MRTLAILSPCAFAAGARRRSAFTTTVCGFLCSKSWIPIETSRRKSRMKMWRLESGAMSFLLRGVESDVARPPAEVLAAVDDQDVAGESRCRHDEAQRTHQVGRGDADTKRILRVLLGEARIGLAAAAQGEAGRDSGHPEPRR